MPWRNAESLCIVGLQFHNLLTPIFGIRVVSHGRVRRRCEAVPVFLTFFAESTVFNLSSQKKAAGVTARAKVIRIKVVKPRGRGSRGAIDPVLLSGYVVVRSSGRYFFLS
jgi:hypothetical protein